MAQTGAASVRKPAGQHGTTGHEDRRNIDTCCGHQKAGNVLIAVRNHHQSIELMRNGHGLGGIGDQVTGDQGILHADMSHGNAVTHSNGREEHRIAAGFQNAHFHRIGNLVEVHVTGNNFIV